MRLSEFFKENEVVRDKNFITLGHADSVQTGTLAYCDTIFYVQMANKNDNVACIITTDEYIKELNKHKGAVLSPSPRNSFLTLHRQLIEKKLVSPEMGRSIGKNCKIHPSALIAKNVRIGDNVTICENVVIKDQVAIGDNTFVDCGAIIGNEGLLYMTENGNHTFVKHAGGVEIGNNVTILSNAVIVKSIHESLLTTIGDNSIVGISSTIGHEAQVGKNCVISGNCVIARRVYLGAGSWVGSSAVIREYVKVGPQAQVKAGSIVIKDVGEKQSVSGNFAMDHQKNLTNYIKAQKK